MSGLSSPKKFSNGPFTFLSTHESHNSPTIERFYEEDNETTEETDIKLRVELYADSHGKGIPELVASCSRGTVYMNGLVKPGAGIEYVYSQAARAIQSPIILMAGTNDMTNGYPLVVYSKMESELKKLSQSRPVCVTTIPPRYDVEPDDALHYDIALANNYIRELVSRMSNVELIDFDTFNRYHFTKHGMHLNMKGKKKLAFMIVEFVDIIHKSKVLKLTNENDPISVIDKNMADVIGLHRNNSTVGFAHSISADFDDPRHMTAGVAVIFKKRFGKPNTTHCATNHIAVQDDKNGASVFSLITKPRYFLKPTDNDYDKAFVDLAKNFKKRGLKHLVCSPIGCVRDNVKLAHFVNNIVQFQKHTEAKVTIVSYYQTSFRKLRNGMSHYNFNKQLKKLISYQSRILSNPAFDNDVNKEIAKDPVRNPAVTEGQHTHQPSYMSVTTMEPAADEQTIMQTSSDSVIVVPGDLTYSEALKQSSVSVESDSVSNIVLCPSASSCSAAMTPALSLNLVAHPTASVT